jgi:16S rRNA (guanine(966)-N(2))-methyltransferase RsmD
MLRVTTGKAKNRKLKTPKIPGFQAVQEVAKSAVLSMLGEKVQEAECLDLFAGSGNMGIEALSRGAAYCDFVDENSKATKITERNLRKCNFQEKTEVHQVEAVKFVADTLKTYDIIFIDPFYKDVKHRFLMELLQEVIKPDGIIVFFHGENLNMENLLKKTGFKVIESRRYGKSYADFLALSQN